MSRFYPIYLDLQSSICLIIGGGEVSARKIEQLLECGGRVIVVSPDFHPDILSLKNDERVTLHKKLYEPTDLDGIDLVIASTNNPATNQAIWDECEKRGIWLNIVDQPSHCKFIVPSLVQRGSLMIAISSEGKSPRLAQKIRRRLEREYGEEYALYTDLIGEYREKIKATVDDIKVRNPRISALATAPIYYAVKQGHVELARQWGEVIVTGEKVEHPWLNLDESTLERLEKTLQEDLGIGDITTRNTVPVGRTAKATLKAKSTGVVFGLELFLATCALIDVTLEGETLVKDGDLVQPGDEILRLSGSAASILQAERTAINLLSLFSGVATLTRQFVDAVSESPQAGIYDTRKTIPLWRDWQKQAVKAGGGHNHRAGLYDMVLIKENHIAAGGGIKAALGSISNDARKILKVEIEIQGLDEIEAALAGQVDIIMLDNLSPEECRQGIEQINGRCQTEISGGITLDNVAAYAATGVDRISIGALTHSAPAFDFSLLVEL